MKIPYIPSRVSNSSVQSNIYLFHIHIFILKNAYLGTKEMAQQEEHLLLWQKT